MTRVKLSPGEPAPHFSCRSGGSERFHFDVAAGRYLVLSFFGSAGMADRHAAFAHLCARKDFFDDRQAALFGVSIDAADEAQGRVKDRIPGCRIFWDEQRTASRLYGVLPQEGKGEFEPVTFIIDPQMRLIAALSMRDVASHNAMFDRLVAALPPYDAHAGQRVNAPVLILPRVFEPDFCRRLIDRYEAQGGAPSGFMQEVDGKTIGVMDSNFKRRSDYMIDDAPTMDAIRARITRRLLPEIARAFQFAVTRMERYLVACYDAESGGFFRPHRDNTTGGTAHRRFACTLNLNTEEYEGGELRFPEFGPQTYRAPTGGAVVFSCSLLHEATPVTKGRRYAFLPFLYDEAAAEIRSGNLASIQQGIVNRDAGEQVAS